MPPTTARKVMAPVLALWGAKGTVGALLRCAGDLAREGRPMSGAGRWIAGTGLQEELPEATATELLAFLTT